MDHRRPEARHEDLGLRAGHLDHVPGLFERRRARQRRRRAVALGHGAEARPCLGHHVVRLHSPADRQHHAGRHVEPLVVGDQRVPGLRLHALLAAERVPRIGMRAVEPAPDEVHARVVGLVAAVPDLLDQEVLHRARGRFGDRRVERDVGHQRQHLGPVARQRGAGDLGVIDLGVGIERAAHALGRLDDLQTVLRRGAAHEHELEEVRDAGVRRGLRARSHARHQREGDHRCGRVLAHEHRHPVRELDAGDRGRLDLGQRRADLQWHGHEQRERQDQAEGGARHFALGRNAMRAYAVVDR